MLVFRFCQKNILIFPKNYLVTEISICANLKDDGIFCCDLDFVLEISRLSMNSLPIIFGVYYLIS